MGLRKKHSTAMLRCSIIRYTSNQHQTQLHRDLQRFVLPLAKLQGRHALTDKFTQRYQRRCPVCNDDQLRDPDSLDRHISFHHQNAADLCATQAPLARYNEVETQKACASSFHTDVVLILDLANLELSNVPRHEVIGSACRTSPLGTFFSKYSVTCVITHELVVPIGPAAAPDLFAKLVTYHPNSNVFTLFVSNGVDKGDLCTGTFLQSLLSSPGVDGRVLVMTNDGGQRCSLQLLHDGKRIRTVSFPRSPYSWGLALEDEMIRDLVEC